MSQNEKIEQHKNQFRSAILLFISFCSIMIAASSAHAAIPRRGLSDQLIADFYAVKAQQKSLDTAQVIPLDMEASSDANLVFSKLADRGISTFINSESFKTSSLGKTTNQVQEELKTEVIVGDRSNPNSIQHRFNLNFEVFQAMAQMTYTGFTNLTIKYKPVDSEINFEVSEKLDKSKDLVFDHVASSDHQLSQVSVRWTF